MSTSIILSPDERNLALALWQCVLGTQGALSADVKLVRLAAQSVRDSDTAALPRRQLERLRELSHLKRRQLPESLRCLPCPKNPDGKCLFTERRA